MPIEALAAIGLAGNIIQFISFSSELLVRTREIYYSASGSSKSHDDINIISNDLRSLSTAIEMEATTDSTLLTLARQCKSVAEELLEAISKLRVKGSIQGDKRWESFRKALQGLWKNPRLVEFESRLNGLRNQLMFSVITRSSHQQGYLVELLQNMRMENGNTDAEVKRQIYYLAKQLESVKEKLFLFHDNHYWNRVGGALSDISMGAKHHVITHSLHYESMKVRHSAIHDAYRNTFDWIFKTDELSSCDPRSAVKFLPWLRDGTGIYWVTGKPGSGKSTLMKHLEDHPITTRILKEWSGQKPLIKASFYFWNPGTEMQKSLQGLMQSLLFYILTACPDLVSTLCPEKLDVQEGLSAWCSNWTVKELRQALLRLSEQEDIEACFYFHVDGLDEYQGDHWDVIEILHNLSLSPNVKLCLSSRPWNCFEDAFGQAGQYVLRVHEVTRQDIELFARENLLAYGARIPFYDQGLFDELLLDIVDRAQGVFLWVRLVVRSLRDGLTNEDQLSLLRQRLHALPTDLENFFMHILRSVDSIYQERMACTFLAALKSNEPLRMIHYSFLDEENPRFGFELPYKKFSDEEIQRRLLQTQRRLNGRYKGLLEPSQSSAMGLHTKVTFLHRTLRDFLETSKMKNMLHSRTSPGFDVLYAISRCHLAVTKFTINSPTLADFADAVDQATASAQETGSFEHACEMLDHIEIACQHCWPNYMKWGPEQFILKVAIHLQYDAYVQYRSRKGHCANIIKPEHTLIHDIFDSPHIGSKSRTLGDALREDFGKDAVSLFDNDYCPERGPLLKLPLKESLNPGLIRLDFEKGADANQDIGGISIWRAFLLGALDESSRPLHKGSVEILKIFVENGADVEHQVDIWASMLKYNTGNSEQSLNFTAEMFELLFTNGLNPNATWNGRTLWELLLRSRAAFRFPRFRHRQLDKDLSRRLGTYSIDMIKIFLHHGADIAMIYKNISAGSWLHTFLGQIKSPIGKRRYSLHLRQLRIFLKFGLDPNSACSQGNTLWEEILIGIVEGLKAFQFEDAYWAIIIPFIVLLLRYGADPRCKKLQNLLEYLPSSELHSKRNHVKELMETVEKELKFVESRDRPTSSHLKHLDGRGLSDSWVPTKSGREN